MTETFKCDRCTFDQPHTHDTEWIAGDWTTVKPGDEVKLTNDDGEVKFTVTRVFQTRDCWHIASAIGNYSEWGWSLFVPAPTTPQPELPTEPGMYADKDGDFWRLNSIGDWYTHSILGAEVKSPSLETVARYAPFVRLEPRADTAKTMAARILSLINGPENGFTSAVRLVAAEFGVTEQ